MSIELHSDYCSPWRQIENKNLSSSSEQWIFHFCQVEKTRWLLHPTPLSIPSVCAFTRHDKIKGKVAEKSCSWSWGWIEEENGTDVIKCRQKSHSMPSTLILHLFFKRKLQINHLPSLFLQFSPLISSSQLASNCSSDHLPSRSFLRRLVAAEPENSRNLTRIILLHSFAFTNGRRSCLPWSRLCRTIARPYLSSISSWPSSWFKSFVLVITITLQGQFNYFIVSHRLAAIHPPKTQWRQMNCTEPLGQEQQEGISRVLRQGLGKGAPFLGNNTESSSFNIKQCTPVARWMQWNAPTEKENSTTRSSTYANLKVSLSIGKRLNEGTTRDM